MTQNLDNFVPRKKYRLMRDKCATTICTLMEEENIPRLEIMDAIHILFGMDIKEVGRILTMADTGCDDWDEFDEKYSSSRRRARYCTGEFSKDNLDENDPDGDQ